MRVAVLRARQDRAQHLHRQPRVRPERDVHAERHPELVVDLGAVARELRADAREHAHHLEGRAVDAHPASHAALRTEQALARAVPDHEHAPALRHVLARDEPPRGDRDVADRLALRLDAAHLERERAPAEGRRRVAPRLAGDAVELARALAQRLDVLLRVPEPAPIHRGREVLRDLARPALHQVLAGALEGGVEHRAQAQRPTRAGRSRAAVPQTRPNSVSSERSGCARSRRSASRRLSNGLTPRSACRSRSRRRESRCGAACARR